MARTRSRSAPPTRRATWTARPRRAASRSMPSAPETTITVAAGRDRRHRAGVLVRSSEPGASFQCRLDGPDATLGDYQPCASPQSFGSWPTGRSRSRCARSTRRATPTPRLTRGPSASRPGRPGPGDAACSPTAPRSDGRPVGVTIAAAAKYTNQRNVELTIAPPDGASGLSSPTTAASRSRSRRRSSRATATAGALTAPAPSGCPRRSTSASTGPAWTRRRPTRTTSSSTRRRRRWPPRRCRSRPRAARPLDAALKAVDKTSGVKSVEVRRAKARSSPPSTGPRC